MGGHLVLSCRGPDLLRLECHPDLLQQEATPDQESSEESGRVHPNTTRRPYWTFSASSCRAQSQDREDSYQRAGQGCTTPHVWNVENTSTIREHFRRRKAFSSPRRILEYTTQPRGLLMSGSGSRSYREVGNPLRADLSGGHGFDPHQASIL